MEDWIESYSNQLDSDDFQHPLLSDNLSEDNELLLALQNLDEEGTIEEQAENLKFRANEQFRLNKYRWDKAIALYDEAIAKNSSDKKAVSTYYSNRAAVNLALGNYRKVLTDCIEAIKLDERNMKAYWRASKAASGLDKLKESLRWIEKALQIDPKNKEFSQEKVKIEKKLKEKAERKKKKLEELRIAMESKKAKGAIAIEAIKQRGIILGKSLYDTQRQYEGEIYLHYDTKELHWPVLLLYDEHNQSEFIQDANENDSLGDHLQYMFPPTSKDPNFPPWDVEKKYRTPDLEIYFEANCTDPIDQRQKKNGSMKKRWIKVKQTTPLKTVLSHPDCIVPGIPVFYIVVANSPFRKALLERDLNS